MRVLGIESSCDETGIAVYSADAGIVAENLYSQVDLHAQYGGVVPELASRDHVRKTLPLIRQTLKEARCALKELDGIAYTSGPGLVGALMVGAGIGRSLAWGLNIPAVGVHHMEAHLLAPLLDSQHVRFPFVALLVSGGHTQLVFVKEIGQYELLGETLDDAAGEAFDKTAQLLGLGYPGGPLIAHLAEQGNPNRFHFPRPMTDRAGLDFSFSGLKTAVQIKVRELAPMDDATRADVASAFEKAVVETLFIKCRRAVEQTKCNALVLAGGVAANTALRNRLSELPLKVLYPPQALCTDNGAMIAYAGYLRLANGYREPLAIATRARWNLEELSR